ncbi:hypothetical protein [Nitrobacter sp.]|uniref:hypothetical protein n=1 Tax=Nitrobacter sp. TaxID=29420 RepID=UPI0025F630A4|nr:hypothetical protein [Nitrobacter sp.]
MISKIETIGMQSFQARELDSDSLIGAFHSESKNAGRNSEAMESRPQGSSHAPSIKVRSRRAIVSLADQFVCRHPQDASSGGQANGSALARHKKTLRPLAA